MEISRFTFVIFQLFVHLSMWVFVNLGAERTNSLQSSDLHLMQMLKAKWSSVCFTMSPNSTPHDAVTQQHPQPVKLYLCSYNAVIHFP